MLLMFIWELSCACFRHSAGFHARVILDGAACRLGKLERLIMYWVFLRRKMNAGETHRRTNSLIQTVGGDHAPSLSLTVERGKRKLKQNVVAKMAAAQSGARSDERIESGDMWRPLGCRVLSSKKSKGYNNSVVKVYLLLAMEGVLFRLRKSVFRVQTGGVKFFLLRSYLRQVDLCSIFGRQASHHVIAYERMLLRT